MLRILGLALLFPLAAPGADAQSPVPVYLHTVRADNQDGSQTQVYHYSTDPQGPRSAYVTDGVAFFAYDRNASGTKPVYRYRIKMGDRAGTYVYYLSTNPNTPSSFEKDGVAFYAYEAPRNNSAPVYSYAMRAGDNKRTQVYYYSTSASTPPNFTGGGAAFHVPPAPPGARTGSGSGGSSSSPLVSQARSLASGFPGLSDWSSWERLFKEEGQLVRANVRIAGQQATVVVYRPIAGHTSVNIAVLVNNLTVGHLIKPVEGTPIDDLVVENAVYIFAAKDNAQSVNVSQLPQLVRDQVSKVRTGSIDLVAGQNLFATIHPRQNGPTGKLLDAIGAPRDLTVHVAYGQRKVSGNRTEPYTGVRLVSPGRWDKPFHLEQTHMMNTTFDLVQRGNEKTIRAWGTGQLKGKSYFMFMQKAGEGSGPFPTAVALDARSITLKDYKDAMLVFQETLFHDAPGFKNLMNGLDQLPLDKVVIENPNYREGGALDSDNNPVFGNVLFMAAGKQDVLPDAGKTKGPIMLAHGRAKVFGHEAGTIDGWFRTTKGMDITARVDLPPWGGMTLGDFDFHVARSGSSYDMALVGHAKLAGVVDEKITMKANNRGFTYELGVHCPLRPVGVKASADSHEIGKGNGFHLSFDAGDPFNCVADIAKLVENAAGTVAHVTEKAYNDIKKEMDEEIKKIGSEAKHAAQWVANHIGGLFGKKKKKPKGPSAAEKEKVRCAEYQYIGHVLWEDECRLSFAYHARVTTKGAGLSFSSMPTAWEAWHGRLVDPPRRTDTGIRVLHNGMPEPANFYRLGGVYPAVDIDISGVIWGKGDSYFTTRSAELVTEIVLFAPHISPGALKGLVVAVSDEVWGDSLMTDASDRVKRFRITESVPVVIIHPDVHVKHIRIYRPGDGIVALAEVLVFGQYSTARVKKERSSGDVGKQVR